MTKTGSTRSICVMNSIFIWEGATPSTSMQLWSLSCSIRWRNSSSTTTYCKTSKNATSTSTSLSTAHWMLWRSVSWWTHSWNPTRRRKRAASLMPLTRRWNHRMCQQLRRWPSGTKSLTWCWIWTHLVTSKVTLPNFATRWMPEMMSREDLLKLTEHILHLPIWVRMKMKCS